MGEMKVIIVDDDASSRTLLSHFTQLVPDYHVLGEAASSKECIELVKQEKPDIALVDIGMPDLNGVETMKICKEVHPSLQVIFTTGHDEYAIDAFDLAAVDYLVKPIERVRLFIALEKAKKSIQMVKSLEAKKSHKGINKLLFKSNQTFVYLAPNEILYIEKEGRKSVVHTETDQFETMESLLEMEERLPDTFFKTHRSYLVNLQRVAKIESLGETYAATFPQSEKKAYISKLKINEVHRLMGT
ncbi:LytTR family DNA-binding domain-containing protein [Neobacillus rhizosphaerae]|uniref:LytR/AlgR family response regulator transcription factor n=1 Tax=Neobacillus rhizosphaerae TaxID=2880965 RepID=UPI003D2E767E